MAKKVRKEECCGCQACTNICESGCIALEVDEEGFWYPALDETSCTGCGKCTDVCPFLGLLESEEKKEFEIYGAWSTDEKIRFSSSSGGIFRLFAELIVEQGGVVFGARINERGDIIHDYAENKEKIINFCKSKYVQSDTQNVYRNVKEFLNDGKKVLFSGTPCQVRALNKFLEKEEKENLYCIDVICVGVSSPGVWKAYLNQLELENESRVTNVIFRHKERDGTILKDGQRNLTLKITFENGNSLYQYCNKNEFFNGFLNKLYLRPSCASCKVKNFNSGSDIQLGDFWEIEDIYPEVLPVTDDGVRIPFGISEVFVYTQKGKMLFDGIKNRTKYFKANRQMIEEIQQNTNWYLVTSGSQQHWNRAFFFEEYKKNQQNIFQIIQKNLGIRNVENMSGIKVGMWGSFNLRESIRIIAGQTNCELEFQFRASTICSIMSELRPEIKCLKIPNNVFRMQMLEHDISKAFRIQASKYFQDIDLFVMDLLEERYECLAYENSIVTKSEGYFESVGIVGMPVEISFEMWKKSFIEFKKLLRSHISDSKIIVVENYLCSQYGMFCAPKKNYDGQEYICSVNSMLAERYQYIKESWPEVKMISTLPYELHFTDVNHRYGCLPEHMNHCACSYIAQRICEMVVKK